MKRKISKKYFWIPIVLVGIAIYVISAMSGASSQDALRQIDTLLVHDLVDSARVELDRIPLSELKSKSDSAYFYLLNTETNRRLSIKDPKDSTINYSVSFYEHSSNKELLARAYYYKGVALLGKTDVPQTILLLKKAEELAENTGNLVLKHKIAESLSYYNGQSFEYDLAIHYALKSLSLAEEMKDDERKTASLIYLASNYIDKGNADSAQHYVRQCLPLIEALQDFAKPYFYSDIGRAYEKTDPQLAKIYLRKALALKSTGVSCRALSRILIKEDSIDKAKELWKEALYNTEGARLSHVRIDIFNAMRGQCEELKDFQQANTLADSIITWKENNFKTQERERIAEIQAKYDKETAVREQRAEFMKWGLVAVIVVLVVIGLLGYRTLLGVKADKELAEKRLLLEQALLESEELREENESNAEDRQRLQREIDQLQRRIDKLQADHTGMLARGKQRYEAICQGGTTVQWTRDDFVNYMEYYKMLDLAFVNELRSGYDRLSPKYMFFAAMEHQGKTDEDIMRIMGVSESTLRSTRSRIRSKCREG